MSKNPGMIVFYANRVFMLKLGHLLNLV